MDGIKTAGGITERGPVTEREMLCERHGRFISRGVLICGVEMWSMCPRCREEKDAEIRRAETEQAAKREEQRFSFIPERYRRETFDTYECETEKQRRVLQCLREYRGDKNIIIHGFPGTGKTHLMWALIKADRGARYWKLSDIIRRVKCSFSPTARESEEDILHELAGVKILVIDEIKPQTRSDFEVPLLFDLIDMRYSNCRATILCSNLPLYGEESIKSYIGDAAMDRINENALEIFCDWENYRKKRPWGKGTGHKGAEL
jgi:DNA replication protein DnaC